MCKQNFLTPSQESLEKVLESDRLTRDAPYVKLLVVEILKCLHQVLSLALSNQTTKKVRCNLFEGELQ